MVEPGGGRLECAEADCGVERLYALFGIWDDEPPGLMGHDPPSLI